MPTAFRLLSRTPKLKYVAAMLIAATFVPFPAIAGCLNPAASSLRGISDEVGSRPDLAYEAAGKPSRNETPIDWAWRQAVRADALDTLSQSAKARDIAKAALAQAPRSSPVYVELLTRLALNSFRAEQANEAAGLVKKALAIPRPIAQRSCLRTAQGELARIAGHSDQAVFHLTAAYAMASGPKFVRQRMTAAEKLSKVMALGGDLNEAISLIDEVAGWNSSRRERYALSNALYFHALYEMKRGDFQAALTDLARSKSLSSKTYDEMGRAYLELQTCRALIGLSEIDTAEKSCLAAHNAFVREHEDSAWQSQILLSRIDMTRKQYRRALMRLNLVLDSVGAKSSGVETSLALRLRSDANAALGRSAAALFDLREYVRQADNERTVEQQKQMLVQRARFATDRQASKNRELVQTIGLVRKQEKAVRTKNRIIYLVGGAAIVLLTAVTLMAVSHRRRLTKLAERDGLTGLLNRRALVERGDKQIAAAFTRNTDVTLAILDLDYFKKINDTLGHEIGDHVLKTFAGILTRNLASTDLISRWGGEEFVLVMQHHDELSAAKLLEVVRCDLIVAGSKPSGISITFSAGICRPKPQESFASALNRADEVLYDAKRSGRNQTHIAGFNWHHAANRRIDEALLA